MVDRVNALMVQFERAGEPAERQVIIIGSEDPWRAGERAMVYALGILARRQRLQVGDQLTVLSAEDPDLEPDGDS